MITRRTGGLDMRESVRTVGRYELIRPVGSGGMALVYLAYQRDLDRYVALKELRDFELAEPEAVDRFMRESRMVACLLHPNIVTVHDLCEHDGVPVIVMEYVARGSLRPLIGGLSVAQVTGVLEGVLSALAHAHGMGIVHRDLKPENVLVADDGRVKLTDFGLAKQLGEATTHYRTRTGQALGTPTYMSPEQAMADSDAVGPRSDLYAVGVMAYEMLVGQPPFRAALPMQVMWQHVNEPPPAARAVIPELDPALAAWLERMLAKAPAERPADAEAAWRALEEVISDTLSSRWRRELRLPARLLSWDSVAPTMRPSGPDDSEGTTFGHGTLAPPSRESSARDLAVPEQLPAPVEAAATLRGRSDTGARKPHGRAGVELPPAGSRHRHRHRARRLAVAAIVAAMTAAGLADATNGTPPQRPARVDTTTFGLTVPVTWGPSRAVRLPSIVKATHETAYTPPASGGGLAVGWVDDESLLGRLRNALQDAVSVGDREALRYHISDSTLYVVPTTAGSVVLACEGPDNVRGACTASLRTLRLDTGTPLAARPDNAYARRLATLVGHFDAKRRRLRQALARSSTPTSQAKAARGLGEQYTRARENALRLSPPELATTRHRAVIRALNDGAAATKALRKAIAEAGKRRYRYTKARQSILTADERLRKALRNFRDLGYKA